MMNNYTIFLYILLIVSFSCVGSAEKETIQTISFPDAKVEEVKNLSFEYKFIPLETTSSNLLGSIKQVEIFDERLFVLDSYTSKTLQVYNLNGDYITTIGGKGEGPGEYNDPRSFFIDRDSRVIRIEDRVVNTIFFYDLDNYRFIKSMKVPFNFNASIKTKEGKYIWYSSTGYINKRKSYYIQVTDSLFDVLSYDKEIEFSTYRFLSCGDPVYQFEDNWYWTPPFESAIYRLTTNGAEENLILSFDSHRVPSTDFLKNAENGNQGYINAVIESNYIGCYAVKETKNFILSTFTVGNMPHYGIYDKRKKEGYKLSYREFESFTGIEDANLALVGTFDDFFIMTVPSNSKSTQSFFPTNETIDDANPIVCLLKFKL